jgi:hypothetical protein
LTQQVSITLNQGQQCERKKLFKFLEINEVDRILYFVSLLDYNKKCYEDEDSNRLIDSLRLFDNLLKVDYKNRIDVIFTHGDLFNNKKRFFNYDNFIELIKKEKNFSNFKIDFSKKDFLFNYEIILSLYKHLYLISKKENEIHYHYMKNTTDIKESLDLISFLFDKNKNSSDKVEDNYFFGDKQIDDEINDDDDFNDDEFDKNLLENLKKSFVGLPINDSIQDDEMINLLIEKINE